MSALALIAQTSAAEEGRQIIIGMLIVGLIFAGIVILGETWHYMRHLRHRR